ncbi:kelch domain-containing protein 10-like [Dreissena polymorpha]|uniref:Kelch domain-containing protein 10 n=1 Tax=Dreissena polymorpha TaxID=45954 RepID=A0A9D4JR90_DREPO|nr:kelch domain-containing protein 10-like [Dreissena polymorpha]KAH3819904.1 hypothetical protein DPMN_121648 [Dreissena polymorpha]
MNLIPSPNAGQPHSFSVINFDNDEILPRSGHRIVLDRHCLYSWGGYNADLWERENDEHTRFPLLRELLEFNFTIGKWRKLTTTGQCPEGLASHTVIKINRHLLHLGGSGVPFGQSNSNALFDLNLDTLEWKCILPEDQDNAPRPKYGQAMVCVDGYLYVVGGTSGYMYDMDVNRLNLADLTWESLVPKSAYVPEERYRHEVVHFKDKLYMIGGGTALTAFPLNEIDSFDIVSHRWEKVLTKPYHRKSRPKGVYPSPRKCHSCHLVVDSMNQENADIYLIGGMSESKIEQYLWRLNLPSLQWTMISPRLRLPVPVYFHASAISSEGCLCIFGGVTKIDSERTNSLQTVWLTVPSLQAMSWHAVCARLDTASITDNVQGLREAGVPEQLLDFR